MSQKGLDAYSNDTVDNVRELLNRYLFNLMNTNILAYRQVLEPTSVQKNDDGGEKSNGRVDYSDFTEQEKDQINRKRSF